MIYWGEIGNGGYYAGFDITVANNDNSSKKATVTLKPLLWFSYGTSRRRHNWVIRFYKNDILLKEVQAVLHDITLYTSDPYSFKADTYYSWGPSYTLEVDKVVEHKDTFKVVIECLATTPWCLPAASASVTFVKYVEKPAGPANMEALFDENTRTITYTWGEASSCLYTTLYRQFYNEKNELIFEGYFTAPGRNNNKLYNRDITDGLTKEVLPDDVAKVMWYMTNFSVTEDYTHSEYHTKLIDTYSKAYIKVGNVYKKAIPWVKVDGEWKKCTKVYTKVNGAWKRTTS